MLLYMGPSMDLSTCVKSTGYFFNVGSLEILKQKKRTYMYESLQFPVEINTRGSKTLSTFIPFHTK